MRLRRLAVTLAACCLHAARERPSSERNAPENPRRARRPEDGRGPPRVPGLRHEVRPPRLGEVTALRAYDPGPDRDGKHVSLIGRVLLGNLK